MKPKLLLVISLLLIVLTGCQTAYSRVQNHNSQLIGQADIIYNQPKKSYWCNGDKLHLMTILTTPPGASIEVNADVLGKSPLTVGIYGTRGGEFCDLTQIRAVPTPEMETALSQGEFYYKTTAYKIFKGGGDAIGDRIPRNVHIRIEKGYASGVSPDMRIKVDVYNW